MAYYGYQYKQQCYVPGGVKYATPVFTQCHNPSAVKCVPCTPCASRGAKLCAVRKTMQSSPKCSTPCSSQCVETHVVQGHSSCHPRSPDPCTVVVPQPHVQVREHLCVPHCGQPGITGCPEICAPAHMYQHSSYPCSYQWSNSYHYNCGQR
ncbi:PREDICTED: cornifin-A-like [Eurypyga helias]|uniref:cornifin-A-like n=1 Tax=Eurypyga helias TaxID=54383 RepID=UPI000528D76E|nr:PREDICTED: cornifin-A-like [Eurypyga helias]